MGTYFATVAYNTYIHCAPAFTAQFAPVTEDMRAFFQGINHELLEQPTLHDQKVDGTESSIQANTVWGQRENLKKTRVARGSTGRYF